MEQLIFIGIIVAFSILDAIARGKKKQAAEPLQVPDEEETLPEVHWEPAPVASYDEDPSFDDRAGAGAAQPVTKAEPLIPEDIWEEIAALARGVPSRPAPAPDPRSPAKPPPRAKQDPRERYLVPEAARARPPHEVHDTHPMMGRPVSERLTPLASGSARAVRVSREITGARSLLAGGGVSLRQAVILHEILGPPAAVRGDPFDPVG